ncbi:MAG TPA: hypothetical protein VL944_01840 [Candidatus Acidoferrum sp.]|nr:hypothetical protein [Candidatus Acidoferrum sp.]
MERDSIPAWIICEDLLVKVKAELANEAILVLQKEVKAGRMKVSGNLVSSEVQNDSERDLFVANEIAAESDEMLQSYGNYIKEKESKAHSLTSDEVIMMETTKRLMLAVQEITFLINYRTVTEEWILEIEGIPQIRDPVELLAHTIHGKEDDRFSVLDFSLKRKSMKDEKVFTDDERSMMERALMIVEHANKAQ